MPQITRVHGRWGEVHLDSKLVAEAVGVEATVEIDQVEVPQAGGEWLSFTEGTVRGNGTLRLVKAYSGFERAFMDYVGKTKAELVELRNQGKKARPSMTMDIGIDDPSVGTEIVALAGVKFWSMTIGYSLTELVNRDWPFTFTSIKWAKSISNAEVFIPTPDTYAIPTTPAP